MGGTVLTQDQSDDLFWLGRYTERVYTTVRNYFPEFDAMIDEQMDSFGEYCVRMDIPNVYTTREDFLKRYPFDPENPDSIAANLNRAFDNAILLRGQIGTGCFAYIQLAVYDLERASVSHAPFIAMQDLTDHILAFWGSIDDEVDDEKIRSIFKAGKRLERLDLYARMRKDREALLREQRRLANRLERSGLAFDRQLLEEIDACIEENPIDYRKVITLTEQIGAHV